MAGIKTTIANAIIARLKASTKTNLKALDDDSIEYGSVPRRGLEDVGFYYKSGILVAPDKGPLEPLTQAVNWDLQQDIIVYIYVVDHAEPGGQQQCDSLAEEIAEELAGTVKLSDGSWLKGIPEWYDANLIEIEDAPPFWAALMVPHYEKTVQIT